MIHRLKMDMSNDWKLSGVFRNGLLTLVIAALSMSIACSSGEEPTSSSGAGDTGTAKTTGSSVNENSKPSTPEEKPSTPEEITAANRAKLFAGIKKVNEDKTKTIVGSYDGDIALTPETAEKRVVKQWDAPPQMSIDTNKQYTATIVLEKGGEIVIELYAKETPVTVNNFVFLAREKFYDGLTFYRVFRELLAQAGDPTDGAPTESTRGGGGPGYTFESELRPDLRHDAPGTVSMANTGGTDTNGSQFFITFVANPDFDGFKPDGSPKECGNTEGIDVMNTRMESLMEEVTCYTVFGRVTAGMEHAENLTARRHVFWNPGDTITTIKIDER